jgi:DNA-binding response OmpR family regulator
MSVMEPTEQPQPTTPINPQPDQPGQHPKRILLVEDDDALANVYFSRLQAEGFDVKRVKNGEDALATALTYRPDLTILDVMMPKVSGLDVLDILRNTPETANLKVIMLTALSQPSDIERAKALGVDDYLVKSQVVIADVIESIRHHLGT